MVMVIRYVVEYILYIIYLVALLERWLLWDSCSNLLVDRSNSVWSWFILRILSLTFLFQVLRIPLQVFRCGVFFSYWQLRLLQTIFKDVGVANATMECHLSWDCHGYLLSHLIETYRLFGTLEHNSDLRQGCDWNWGIFIFFTLFHQLGHLTMFNIVAMVAVGRTLRCGPSPLCPPPPRP